MKTDVFKTLFIAALQGKTNANSYDFCCGLQLDNETATPTKISSARVHACITDGGDNVTLFLRTTDKPFTGAADLNKKSSITAPKAYPLDGSHYSKLFEPYPSNGLIAIFGQTNSGKSELAKWLCYSIIQDLRSKNKTHFFNVIMAGNPVENFWAKGALNNFEAAIKEWQRGGINLIIRHQKTDYDNLNQALLSDAKRQTPRLVFIHEVQNKNEWPIIVDFALTGHLVIATGHASNVREGISTILRSYKATTPQQRATVARALKAVAHCKMETVNDETVQFVSFWKGNPVARNTLTKFGQGAILPAGNGVSSYCESFKKALCAANNDNTRREKLDSATASQALKKAQNFDFEQIFS
jgi:hypothetical protein